MRRKIKVLIIDDEKDFGLFLKMNMESTGRYKVFLATTGPEGIKLTHRKKPNVIVLDIRMPDMDGFEVLDQIKGNTKSFTIPVIMLTALDTGDSRFRAMGSFVKEYVVKPVELEELISVIDRVLLFG